MRPDIMARMAAEAADCVVGLSQNWSPMSHLPLAASCRSEEQSVAPRHIVGLLFPADIHRYSTIKISGWLESPKADNICAD